MSENNIDPKANLSPAEESDISRLDRIRTDHGDEEYAEELGKYVTLLTDTSTKHENLKKTSDNAMNNILSRIDEVSQDENLKDYYEKGISEEIPTDQLSEDELAELTGR